MGALVGFVLGYMVGAKQGPEGYARLRDAIHTILTSAQLKDVVERGAGLSELFPSRNGDSRDSDGGGGWRAFAESEAVQSIVAGGLSMAGSLLERGLAMLGERRGRDPRANAVR